MKSEVIVIGAGVGGLSAAAYLAQAGIETLVIECTAFPGGRCYSRVIDGCEYDIGAIYLGSRVPRLLKSVFGIDCLVQPFNLGVKIGDALISVPFNRQTLRELRKCQVSGSDLLRFLSSLPKLYQHSFFERYDSAGEVVDALTSNATLRRLAYVLFGVSGVSPYRLPSHYLEMGKRVTGTVVGNPVHFAGGNKRVADLLVDFVHQHGGRLAFQEKVEQILWQDQSDFRIVTERGEYTCDFVISNAGIKTTILGMTSSALWNKAFWAEVQALKTTLQVVNIFLTFSSSLAFPPGYGAFFAATDPVQEFALLEKGQFPEQSMFILQVPTNLEKGPVPYHQATCQFYCPRGEVSPQALEQQVRHVMTEGFDRLFAGLSQQVMSYQVYDPTRYEREFGLKPFVFGISPDICNRRFGLQTPRERLFCVGDSVLPERPSVPQAIESGILCAQEIVKQRTGLRRELSPGIEA